jgi:hypothetical protein
VRVDRAGRDPGTSPPVTDQGLPHAALSGWSVERLVAVLLGEPLGSGGQTQPGDVLDLYVHLAFETVVPANLATVPIDKIIEPKLDGFRAHVTKHVEQLADLTTVTDLGVFLEYIRNDVERSVSRQLEELRERLRSVGLESVRALANVKSLALPPARTAPSYSRSRAECRVASRSHWLRRPGSEHDERASQVPQKTAPGY